MRKFNQISESLCLLGIGLACLTMTSLVVAQGMYEGGKWTFEKVKDWRTARALKKAAAQEVPVPKR